MNCIVATIGVLMAFALAGGLSGCNPAPETASAPVAIPAGVTAIGSEARPAKALWLSGDGRVVAGYTFPLGPDPAEGATGTSPQHSSFRWTKDTALTIIKVPNGTHADISAMSADGAVLAGGYCDNSFNGRLFRWTQAGGFEDLGSLGPNRGMSCLAGASAVAAGGTTIYGRYPDGERGSFRWTRSGGVRSMHIPGDVTAASADGSVVTGFWFTGGRAHVFLWSLTRGFEDLGAPPGAAIGDGAYVSANAISADGSTVVGEFEVAAAHHTRAFRWTRRGGFEALAGDWAEASGVSGDGSQIVGALWSAKGPRAVEWVGNAPPQPVAPPGLGAFKAKAISADGRTIVAIGPAGPGEVRSFVITVK